MVVRLLQQCHTMMVIAALQTARQVLLHYNTSSRAQGLQQAAGTGTTPSLAASQPTCDWLPVRYCIAFLLLLCFLHKVY